MLSQPWFGFRIKNVTLISPFGTHNSGVARPVYIKKPKESSLIDAKTSFALVNLPSHPEFRHGDSCRCFPQSCFLSLLLFCLEVCSATPAMLFIGQLFVGHAVSFSRTQSPSRHRFYFSSVFTIAVACPHSILIITWNRSWSGHVGCVKHCG